MTNETRPCMLWVQEIDPLKGIPLFDPDVPLVQDEDEDEDFQNDITERELRGCL